MKRHWTHGPQRTPQQILAALECHVPSPGGKMLGEALAREVERLDA